MGTASAAPIGHQPETRDPTKSRRTTDPKPSLHETPQEAKKARRPKKIPQPAWSKREDAELTELKENFDQWDTLNGWEVISAQMRDNRFVRDPRQCKVRWQERLRKESTKGPWTQKEEDLLLKFRSQNSDWVEVVDLLERNGIFRTVAQCTGQHSEISRGVKIPKSERKTEHKVDWSPEMDQKLIDLRESETIKRKAWVKVAQEFNAAFLTNVTAKDCERRWDSAALRARRARRG